MILIAKFRLGVGLEQKVCIKRWGKLRVRDQGLFGSVWAWPWYL